MKHYSALLLLIAFFACVCTAIADEPSKNVPSGTSQAPSTQMSVTRYTELPLSEFQTKVMNEATKLSFACRYFRSLYGRWPKNIAEIQSKTEGIDYGVFLGKAKVTPLKDDAAEIQIFDGKNTRSVKAVPVDFPITAEQKAEAQKPEFKIKL